ncbi:MAG: tRNA (adenosine(37)-N6)-threonylcarbamoyltransferase complex dimerization subunit type 1 TsaB, partial [Synergistes sp.]|nr:tRNA (adenosine(37)-N6)-threonylcarbamoyltransferase complex dimerization subunit type 1 TsaB [Synergistes sp.]
MNTLGIDCAGRYTNVGIAADGKIIAERCERLGRRQSEELPLLTESVLEEAGLKLSELDLIAVGAGPGYYTGIRAGIAYGAALAEALGLSVAVLSSLEIYINDLKGNAEYVAPVYRARPSRFYAAIYGSNSGKFLLPPTFIRADDFIDTLKHYEGAVIVSPDFAEYPALKNCGFAVIERESARGGETALLGERYAHTAVSPLEVRG